MSGVNQSSNLRVESLRVFLCLWSWRRWSYRLRMRRLDRARRWALVAAHSYLNHILQNRIRNHHNVLRIVVLDHIFLHLWVASHLQRDAPVKSELFRESKGNGIGLFVHFVFCGQRVFDSASFYNSWKPTHLPVPKCLSQFLIIHYHSVIVSYFIVLYIFLSYI